jgi:hypothetical protein
VQKRIKVKMELMNSDKARELRRKHQAELEKLMASVVSHMVEWSRLEMSMSMLFHETLRINNGNSNISYAIFFTPDGFDSRQKLLNRAMCQFLTENNLNTLSKPWIRINSQLNKSRAMRNKIAHGAPLILNIKGEEYVRLAPPAHDVNRIGNLIPKGSIPGVEARAVHAAVINTKVLIACINATKRVVLTFHENGHKSLHDTFPLLEAHLKTLPSHRSSAQTEEE